MGRFPTLMGRFPECLNGPFALLKTPLENSPLRKKRFLNPPDLVGPDFSPDSNPKSPLSNPGLGSVLVWTFLSFSPLLLRGVGKLDASIAQFGSPKQAPGLKCWFLPTATRGNASSFTKLLFTIASPLYLGNGRGILSRQYCVGEENSVSLTEFYGKLGEFCEKLGEFVLAHR